MRQKGWHHTPETRAKMSAAHILWNELNPMPPEQREQRRQLALRRMREGTLKCFVTGNSYGGFKSPEHQKNATEASTRVTTGSHGFGRVKRGRLDHCSARVWRVVSPTGQVFAVSNLSEWCRQNESLFPDPDPNFSPSRAKWQCVLSGLIKVAQDRNNYTYKDWMIEHVDEAGKQNVDAPCASD